MRQTEKFGAGFMRVIAGILWLCLSAVAAPAQGGPPMRTDDPGTPGNGNFEINLAVTSDRRPDERVLEAPLLDINYGLGSRLQLKFEIPFVIQGTNGTPTKSGLGNSTAGVKWRFLENTKRGVEISTYPQLEFNNPTASVHRGIADRGVRMLLPLEATKKAGPIDLNVEVGYAIHQYGAGEWIAGVAAGRLVTERLEVMGEINAASRNDASDHETTVDLGTRYKLRGPLTLLLMVGHTVRQSQSGEPKFVGYGGLQFAFSARRHREPAKQGQ